VSGGRVVILFEMRDTGLLDIFYRGTMYNVSKQSNPLKWEEQIRQILFIKNLEIARKCSNEEYEQFLQHIALFCKMAKVDKKLVLFRECVKLQLSGNPCDRWTTHSRRRSVCGPK
jgi:hypothetical protein